MICYIPWSHDVLFRLPRSHDLLLPTLYRVTYRGSSISIKARGSRKARWTLRWREKSNWHWLVDKVRDKKIKIQTNIIVFIIYKLTSSPGRPISPGGPGSPGGPWGGGAEKLTLTSLIVFSTLSYSVSWFSVVAWGSLGATVPLRTKTDTHTQLSAIYYSLQYK